MASAPDTMTARVSRMPIVAPTRPPPGTSVTRTPNRPPAVAARTAARGSTRPSVRPVAPRIASVTAGASRRVPPASPGHGQAEPDERPEDEEEPQVGRRGQAAPVDDHDLARLDRGREGDRHDETDQADHGRQSRSRSNGDPEAGERERDDDEDEQAHRGSAGWASLTWLERWAVAPVISKPATPSLRAA